MARNNQMAFLGLGSWCYEDSLVANCHSLNACSSIKIFNQSINQIINFRGV